MSVFTKEFTANSPEETIEIGRQIGSRLTGGEIIAYKGGLGAGKTTFTRGLSLGMGLGDDVSSPTFAIVNEYRKSGRLTLYHFDMYRINGRESLESTGFFDYISDDGVIAAEWSENIEDELDEGTIEIRFEKLDENRRRITLTAPDGVEKFAGNWN